MRLLAFSLVLFSLCLVSAGCALFDKDKKNASSGNGSSGNAPNAPRKDGDPLLGGGARANPQPDAVPATAFISGYVLNDRNDNVDNAHILLAKVDDDSKTIPVDVVGGFFSVEKLRPGQKYKLTAWAKVGDRRLATTAQTYAPNSSLVLRLVNEDQGGNEPAPPPGPPSKISPPTKTTGADGDQEFAPSVGSIMVPISGQSTFEAATANPGPMPFQKQTPPTERDDFPDLPNALMRIPPSIYPPSTAATTPTPQDPQPLGSLAKATVNPRDNWPPGPMTIKAPTKKAAEELRPQPILSPGPPSTAPPSNLDPPPPNLNFPPLKDDLSPPPSFGPDPGPARVPSCQMSNGRLVNFALKDVNGEPWEFRKHKGKVVLLDFWYTTCNPCLQSIPKLRELRARYGSKLEIVGIACELKGSPEAQAQRVNRVSQEMYIGYRQLLWSGSNCPVANEFQVDRFPTMVLLDDNGVVLKRFVGVLGRPQQDELERLIQKQLNLQP